MLRVSDILSFLTHDALKANLSTIDTILGRYGEVMTWEMKAGCMGKREFALDNASQRN